MKEPEYVYDSVTGKIIPNKNESSIAELNKKNDSKKKASAFTFRRR